jgi:hypothetical protein
MNSCIIDIKEEKSKDLILKQVLFGKECKYLVEPLKAGDLLLEHKGIKYCAELKIDADWTKSYNNNDWIEKIGNLIYQSSLNNWNPVVLVTLSESFLQGKLSLDSKWTHDQDIGNWIKKFYDIKERILMTYPHVIFKLCFDSFLKDQHIPALEVGLKWYKKLVEGTLKEKEPIKFDHPILVRDYTKNPVLALASLSDGITVETALDILTKVGNWFRLCEFTQDELVTICKSVGVSKYNSVAESIYVGLRLQITKQRGDQNDAEKSS